MRLQAGQIVLQRPGVAGRLLGRMVRGILKQYPGRLLELRVFGPAGFTHRLVGVYLHTTAVKSS